MNNKEQTKKQWQAPQIVDLDLKDTESGVTLTTYEDSFVQPTSS